MNATIASALAPGETAVLVSSGRNLRGEGTEIASWPRVLVAVTTTRLLLWEDAGWLRVRPRGSPTAIPLATVDRVRLSSGTPVRARVDLTLKDGSAIEFGALPAAARRMADAISAAL